jgi:hypothetical protein
LAVKLWRTKHILNREQEQAYMIEIAIVVLLVLALFGLSVVVRMMSMAGLFSMGAACVALGLLVGLPVALYYHIRLLRALHRLGASTRGWWLDPRPLQSVRPVQHTFSNLT